MTTACLVHPEVETLFIDATAATGTLGPSNSKGSSRVSYGKYCKVLQVLFLAALYAPVPSLPGAVGLKSRPSFFHCGGFPSFPTASAWCGATHREAQRDPMLEPSSLPASAFPSPHTLRAIGNRGTAPIPLLPKAMPEHTLGRQQGQSALYHVYMSCLIQTPPGTSPHFSLRHLG